MVYRNVHMPRVDIEDHYDGAEVDDANDGTRCLSYSHRNLNICPYE